MRRTAQQKVFVFMAASNRALSADEIAALEALFELHAAEARQDAIKEVGEEVLAALKDAPGEIV